MNKIKGLRLLIAGYIIIRQEKGVFPHHKKAFSCPALENHYSLQKKLSFDAQMWARDLTI